MRVGSAIQLKLTAAAMLLVMSKLSAQDFQLHTGDGLPDVGRSSSVWADFNNDMLMDIAISGINSSGEAVSGIYLNNGDGSFSSAGAGIAALSDGDIAVGDINNDGLVDLLMNGSDAAGSRVSRLYKNVGAGAFTPLSNSFAGVAYGGASIADVNNDGWDDVIISGIKDGNERISQVHFNNGDETFSLSESLIGLSHGGLLLVDIDNNGYQDIIINGIDNSNQLQTLLYHNDGTGTFKLSDISLPKLRAGKFAASDVNTDGFADLFVSGINSSGVTVSDVYVNNSGFGFNLMSSLPGLGDGSGAFGDYDNDGQGDLVFFGYSNPDLKLLVYTNQGGTGFADSGDIFAGYSSGSVSWGDFDSDNKIDFLISGYTSSGAFTNIYRNIQANVNTLPQAPSGLTATTSMNSVLLEWTDGSDAETDAAALSYEVYIGTSPGSMNIVRTESTASGIRKAVSKGTYKSGVTFKDLGEGQYYWSVQSVDASHAGSPFASEQQFVICDPVTISASATEVCPASVVQLSVGAPSDDIKWYSLKTPGMHFDTGTDIQVEVWARDTIYAELTKPLGCTVLDTIIVDVLPVPEVALGSDLTVCSGEQVDLAIGDFDGTVNWYLSNNPGTSAGTGNSFSLQVTEANTVVAVAEDLNGCTNSDTVAIGIIGKPQINLDHEVSGCPGAVKLFAVEEADSVNWYTQQKGLVVADALEYSHEITEEDHVWAEVFNTGGCVNYDTVAVHLHSLPVADAGENKFLCDMRQQVNIGGNYDNTSGLNFSWTPATTLDDPASSNPVATPGGEAAYYLLVTDQNGCEASDTVHISVNPPSTIDPGIDVSICVGESVTLGGDPTAAGSQLPYSYIWSGSEVVTDPSTSNPVVTPNETTTYRLITSTGECIIDTSFVAITVHPLPEISAGEDITAGFEEPVTLQAQGGESYIWLPAEGLDNDQVADPVATLKKTSTYTVTGTDSNGCKNDDSITITLKAEVFVPTLFTPNGDGDNDIFLIYGFGISSVKLKIFDMSGQLVFKSDQPEGGWDGTIRGAQAESGDYLWSLSGHFFDGSPLNSKGKNSGIIRLMR